MIFLAPIISALIGGTTYAIAKNSSSSNKSNWLMRAKAFFETGKFKELLELCKMHVDDDDRFVSTLSNIYSGISCSELASAIEDNTQEKIDYCDKAIDYLNDGIRSCGDEDEMQELLVLANYYICKVVLMRQYPDEIVEARLISIRLMGLDPSLTKYYNGDLTNLFNELNDDFIYTCNQFQTINEDVKELRISLEKENCPKEEIDSIIAEELIKAENSKFTNRYSLSERRFIFLVQNTDKIAGCVDDECIINWVFTINKIPKDLLFPIGHPQPNTLYIAHPAQKGMYLPYEGAEEKLFHEKVDEFIRLAQCLGAKEISYRSLKGESVSDNFSSNLNVDGNIGVKSIDVNGSYSQRQNTSSQSNNNKEEVISYRYKPNSKPYVPEDLIWLETDNSWKNFIKQRLEGNTLYFTNKISSEGAINVSNSLALGVKAAFNYLMVNANGSYDKNTDTTFSHNQNTEWEIKIEFASIDEIEASNTDEGNDKTNLGKSIKLSEDEEKYRDEVLFILEDGLITETERKFLERKRIKLGLSIERAAEIEAMCTPSLMEDEKEYLELYKEIIEDGPITERKRKMLSREAESLGISPERAEELEKQV